MDWETLESVGQPAQPDILLDARALEERLQEIVYNLNPSTNHTQIQQTERDQEILEQFHVLGTTGHNDYISEFRWALPLNTATLSDKLDECLRLLESLVNRVIVEEVQVYRRQAQLTPPSPAKCLNLIQNLCEVVLDLMQGLQRILNRLQENIRQNHLLRIPMDTLVRLQPKLTSLFEYLLRESLIVENQPPQVLKVNTKFPHPLRLRWLVGEKVMAVWNGRLVNGSPVNADIVNESQARELVTSTPQVVLNRGDFKPCGLLSSDRSKPEFIQSEEPGGLTLCVVNYRHMLVKRIDREYKKVKGGHQQTSLSGGSGRPGRPRRHSGTSPVLAHNPPALQNSTFLPTVTDEKFCIFFHMLIDVGDNRLLIFAFSHPLVIITHGVQESHAWATVTWDNCFTLNKLPFDVPDRVSWSKLAHMLNSKFENATGRGLDSRQLDVLRSKLVPDQEDQPDSDTMITFTRFAKELMPESSLVFWEWFYGCLKLTDRHFSKNFRDGAVYGFIGRVEAEKMLNGWSPGTFLLRYSDSVLGGISICYVSSNGTRYSIAPFTTKNLTFRSLSDSLWDLDNLTTVYPNMAKETLFAFRQTTHTGSVNYSILKGLYAKQSQSNKTSPTKSYSSSTTSSMCKLSTSVSSPVTSSALISPTRTFTEISTRPVSESEYVESYPRMSLPHSFI